MSTLGRAAIDLLADLSGDSVREAMGQSHCDIFAGRPDVECAGAVRTSQYTTMRGEKDLDCCQAHRDALEADIRTDLDAEPCDQCFHPRGAHTASCAFVEHGYAYADPAAVLGVPCLCTSFVEPSKQRAYDAAHDDGSREMWARR